MSNIVVHIKLSFEAVGNNTHFYTLHVSLQSVHQNVDLPQIFADGIE